jgi:hypothetical protein
MQWYTRKEVVPRTKAICLAGLTETDLAPLCTEFATTLSHGARVGTVGTFTPLCQPVCFHSCGSSSNQDHDGYDNCKGPECADTLCSAFLLLECPSSTHTAIQAMVDRTCYAGMPLPPPLPYSSIHPPSPPFAPPPLAAAYGKLRLASAELPSDEDCAFVTYQACRSAAEELGTTLKLSTEIEIQLSACEGSESVQSCFLGCSLGASSGAPATYSFLTAEREEKFGKYMHRRCTGAPHAYCLCGYPTSSPPPPPTVADETEWQYAAPVDPVDNSGHSTAFYKWVADDVRLPENLRSSPIEYSCPGVDTGSATCARHCSGEFGDHLVAFSVTGIITSPSPPMPPFPPNPPVLPDAMPPPPPPPVRDYAFHGATDLCRREKALYDGPECRDGGVGSVYPWRCPYGSQVCANSHYRTPFPCFPTTYILTFPNPSPHVPRRIASAGLASTMPTETSLATTAAPAVATASAKTVASDPRFTKTTTVSYARCAALLKTNLTARCVTWSPSATCPFRPLAAHLSQRRLQTPVPRRRRRPC